MSGWGNNLTTNQVFKLIESTKIGSSRQRKNINKTKLKNWVNSTINKKHISALSVYLSIWFNIIALGQIYLNVNDLW